MANNLLNAMYSISDSLTTLSHQVQSEAAAGLLSRNKLAEHIYLPVLRRVFAAPGLSNTNVAAANFPGIDLFDPASGLGVQVTADGSAAKVTDTIDVLVGANLPVTHLVVALIAHTKPAHRRTTRATWAGKTEGHFAFAPDADILAISDLLARIENLPLEDITAIDVELSSLVRGVAPVQLLPHLRAEVEVQLAEERRTGRYIPNVFVEARNTKYQARCFGHPALYSRRIADWFARQPVADLNRLAAQSAVPAIAGPGAHAEWAGDTLTDSVHAAEMLLEELRSFEHELVRYSEAAEDHTRLDGDAGRAYVLEETRYLIEMEARHLQLELGDRRAELRCSTAPFFLLTGPAGQGKTNFVCDFTERFLLRHDIPCGYVTARELARSPELDLGEAVRRRVFPPGVSSLAEALGSLEETCEQRRQPFVLVIDGLNEHPRIGEFAGQLEHMLEELSRLSHVRVLMTCRSEFLRERFGQLLSGRLGPMLHVSEAHGQRLDDDEHRELLATYFRFFRVKPSLVAPRVRDLLRRDVLLLRFFCDAYGARGRGREYVQPRVDSGYRREIFETYLTTKLKAAARTAEGQPGVRPLVRKPAVGRVLGLLAQHMLESGHFADVPREVVPADLDGELTALLDEDLILRKDLTPRVSALDEPREVLNFTFDEMRDFLLAEHLLTVHARDAEAFRRVLAVQPPTSPSAEGLQRFLFYAARDPSNESFLATYRNDPWYAHAYDEAVFDVPPSQLDAEDERIVEAALRAGGPRAIDLCRRVAVRWDPSHDTVLNLGLLLRVVQDAGPAFFVDVVTPAFGASQYGQKALARSFCDFVREKVLGRLDPTRHEGADLLFRLLLILAPVNATPTLDSGAMAVFGELLDARPEYALALLSDALREGPQAHRPFLWRLLSGASSSMRDLQPYAAAAERDATDGGPEVRREAARFLARLGASER